MGKCHITLYMKCVYSISAELVVLRTDRQWISTQGWVKYMWCWRALPSGIQRRVTCLLLARLIRPWRWRRYVPPKRQLTFNGLHGVISQKIALFITAAVRTSYRRGNGGIAPSFLTLAVHGERSASRSGHLILGDGAQNTHWIGGWVGTRAGLEGVGYRTIFVPAGNRIPPAHPVGY
jgi:hypothetical protein